MVIVIIKMKALPEKWLELKQSLLALAEPTRKEKGCLSHDVFQDIENDNGLSLIDVWENREDLDVDQRKSWVDPFFGARWNWRMADKWGLRLRGDFGGFGIGSDSTWNAIGLIIFKPWKHVAFGGGYRALYQDYSTGSGRNKFRYDATMYGPILGLDISW